jgi:hypothetical protein
MTTIYFGSRQGIAVRFARDSEIIVEAPGGKPNEQVDVLISFEPGGELEFRTASCSSRKRAQVQDLNTDKTEKK